MILALILWIKSFSLTIHTKATEQYFSVVLFVMLHNVCNVQMKVTEQYFPKVAFRLFIEFCLFFLFRARAFQGEEW